jgi:hypothetical protein
MTPDGAQPHAPGPGQWAALAGAARLWRQALSLFGGVYHRAKGHCLEREKEHASRRLAIRGREDLREWPDETPCRSEGGDLGGSQDVCRVPSPLVAGGDRIWRSRTCHAGRHDTARGGKGANSAWQLAVGKIGRLRAAGSKE